MIHTANAARDGRNVHLHGNAVQFAQNVAYLQLATCLPGPTLGELGHVKAPSVVLTKLDAQTTA